MQVKSHISTKFCRPLTFSESFDPLEQLTVLWLLLLAFRSVTIKLSTSKHFLPVFRISVHKPIIELSLKVLKFLIWVL